MHSTYIPHTSTEQYGQISSESSLAGTKDDSLNVLSSEMDLVKSGKNRQVFL